MIGALCAAAAVLLAWSGLSKLRDPGPTTQMVARLLGRRSLSLRPLTRVIGMIEIAVGAVVLATGDRVGCAALAGCYLAFTLVAVRLATGPRPAPCGCFGRSDAPTGPVHVAVDLVAFGAAVAGLLAPFGSLGGLAGQGRLVAVVGLAQIGVLAALAHLLLTALPDVFTARKQLVVRP